MTRKTVTIRYEMPAAGDSDSEQKQALTDIFLGVAGQYADASLSVKAKLLKFTVDRATFVSLIEKDTLPASIVDAFNKADARLGDADIARSGFLARLVDSLRFDDLIKRGLPVMIAPQFTEDMNRVKVTVERYGLASKPKPE